MKKDDIYQAYNARHLKPKEVGESFIWSESFEKLMQNSHSVILGARGCGKTTLMKMLTIPALNSWNDERAEKTRLSIPFYAVYISTDIYWDVQNYSHASELGRFDTLSEKVSAFSVNSNVFTSICDTFTYIIEHLGQDDESKEIELCKLLIEAWELESTIPKVSFVKESLNKRIDKVSKEIQNLIFNSDQLDSVPNHSFFNLNFETSLEYIIPIFERIYNIEGLKDWALCFDELEFAPKWLQEKLFKSLRSRKQYILYKLSASPILSSELEKLLQSEYAPTSGNDMHIIKMWNSNDNETFSKQIISSILKKKFPDRKVQEFFGSNEVYNSSSLYERGSSFHKQIIDLSLKDESFRNFLSSYKIDPLYPNLDDRKLRDTLFRKIKPIVYFRNFYIDANFSDKKGQKVSYRSRKTSSLFSGLEVLSKICDGNPRWLIGIINSILSKSLESGSSKELQYKELHSAALRFKNVIANIPVGSHSQVTLIEIIEKIGRYFKSQVLGEKFLMDPKGTFTVDDGSVFISDNIIVSLEKATSQGAIVLVESNDDGFDFKIRGQRFKLAYLFSLLYDIPLRNYPSAKLSECLKDIQSSNQKSLFE